MNVSLEGFEPQDIEVFAFQFVFSQVANPIDREVVRWFISNAFLFDSKIGVYLK